MTKKPNAPDLTGFRPGRRQLLQGSALAAAGFSLSTLLSACGKGFPPQGFDNSPRFVFINHRKNIDFFKATQYGIQDACAALDCVYAWWGADNNNVTDMVQAFHQAISEKVDGIAVSLIANDPFVNAVDTAFKNNIPVIAYNADAPLSENKPLSYIGQQLVASGEEVGRRMLEKVPDGRIIAFIKDPNDLNTGPRMEGVKNVLKQKGFLDKLLVVVTDTMNPGSPGDVIDDYAKQQKELGFKGMITVNGTTTENLANTMEVHFSGREGDDRIYAAGYDTLPGTIKGIQNGSIAFTIDQQPYLQGFMPVVQLFLYKISGGSLHPSNIDTGSFVVTKDNIAPYLDNTRFNGKSEQQKVIQYS